jgi:RNA polymerase sigma-70 factor (ECF subfamily)
LDKQIQKQLVESACNGDIGSFGKLYEHYYATMVWLAYSIVPDYSLAEDVAQQSFAIACKNLSSLRNKEKFAGWLSAICRNAAYTNLAKSKRENVSSIDETVLACNQAGNDEENKIVQQAVFSLPQMYREIVVLHYYNDMSYEQIKSALGISLNSVKGRLRRARKKIEHYLNGRLFKEEV